jgi:DNA replication and repair protein RecF
MRLRRLWLDDFRSYEQAEVELADGLTAVLGDNGQGKTNLLEAVAWLATLSSFRGAPDDALVRRGAAHAVIRAEGSRDERALLLEAQISPAGRNRVLVNRQPLKRSRDLLGVLRVTVFAPDDLELVKGGPGERRRWLDEALVALHPRNDALRGEVDRIIRQRNALLKQAAGQRPERLAPDVAFTLDVWDDKLADAGTRLVDARRSLLESVSPALSRTYAAVAGCDEEVQATYAPSFGGDLRRALADARGDDLRRAVTTAGPHRDEVVLTIGGMPARTHGSQGEQRSLALAMRLATHEVVTDASGSPPLLLLDDVFSELDRARSDALLAHLPPGQTLLTSASGLPPGAAPDLVLRIAAGTVAPAGVGSG